MAEENAADESSAGPAAEITREDLQTQLKVAQEITEELLQSLGEAWARIEELEQEVASLTKDPAPAPTASASPASAPPPALAAPQKESKQAGPKLHGVLIVDDSKLVTMRLRSLIEPLGYQVVGTAADGMSGAQKAISLLPKLVILDYNMPVMNGLECLKAIRLQNRDIKFIVCSASITTEMSQDLIREGVNALLTKPIQLDRFIKAVRQCMNA
ncbi:response regulator [bacterium]|nr:response regulator [bacterium]